jgi:predicted permease
VFSTGLSPERAKTPDSVRSSLRQLGDRAAAAGGVEAASVEMGVLPFGHGSTSLGFWPASESRPRQNEMREALSYFVGPEYLELMRIPLLRGRNFTRQDDALAPSVGLVDEEFARSVFPHGEALGQRIRLGFGDTQLEIVGVVGHVKHWGLDDDEGAKVRAQLYLAYSQLPDAITSLVRSNVTVVVRSGVPTRALLPSLQRELAGFDSTQTIGSEGLLVDAIAGTIATRRFAMFVLGVFAALALLLSCIGIYSVVSYLTAQRTAEIGVRMALGAKPWGVLWLVLHEGQRLATFGIVLGLIAAMGLTKVMSNLLYEVSPTDPTTLVAVSALLMSITVLACYVPARRAARIDPVTALRAE